MSNIEISATGKNSTFLTKKLNVKKKNLRKAQVNAYIVENKEKMIAVDKGNIYLFPSTEISEIIDRKNSLRSKLFTISAFFVGPALFISGAWLAAVADLMALGLIVGAPGIFLSMFFLGEAFYGNTVNSKTQEQLEQVLHNVIHQEYGIEISSGNQIIYQMLKPSEAKFTDFDNKKFVTQMNKDGSWRINKISGSNQTIKRVQPLTAIENKAVKSKVQQSFSDKILFLQKQKLAVEDQHIVDRCAAEDKKVDKVINVLRETNKTDYEAKIDEVYFLLNKELDSVIQRFQQQADGELEIITHLAQNRVEEEKHITL